MMEQIAEWRDGWRYGDFGWRAWCVFAWFGCAFLGWAIWSFVASAIAPTETVVGEVLSKHRREGFYTFTGRTTIYNPPACYVKVEHDGRTADVSVPCDGGYYELKPGDKIMAPFPK